MTQFLNGLQTLHVCFKQLAHLKENDAQAVHVRLKKNNKPCETNMPGQTNEPSQTNEPGQTNGPDETNTR